MVQSAWSNLTLMESYLSLCVFLAMVPAMSCVRSTCPQNVEIEANTCFTSYSFHSQSLYNSPEKLCCGVDVETLRAFCHSYKEAISCIKQLKRSCSTSEHPAIDKILNNTAEAKSGLMDLCFDDNVVESYAMYQACFTHASIQSEHCFTRNLKDSSSIRFLSKVNTKNKETFCRNMLNTVSCVQRNVGQTCGAEAARMSVLLVRPMVRDSSDCDYTGIESTGNKMASKAVDKGKSFYVSGENRSSRGSAVGGNDNGKRRGYNKKNTNSGHETYSVKNQNGDDPKNSGSVVKLSTRCVLLVCIMLFALCYYNVLLFEAQSVC